jgi:uncharacterized membrane protein YdfJ with MMPL/SSD domain
VLVLGAGTDYGLFLILRVREELRRGLSTHDAVVEAIDKVGEPITFSGGTVIGALLCLLLATFGVYRGLGPGLAIGIFLMLLAALTLLPALLSLFGRAVFWPLRIEPGEAKVGTWGRIATAIVGRPVRTLIGGVLGQAATGYDVSKASNNDLLHIVPLVMALIAVLLGVVLHGARRGLQHPGDEQHPRREPFKTGLHNAVARLTPRAPRSPRRA